MGLTWLRDPGFACNSAISQSRGISAWLFGDFLGRDENLEDWGPVVSNIFYIYLTWPMANLLNFWGFHI